jgi:hypothetical protein
LTVIGFESNFQSLKTELESLKFYSIMPLTAC